MVLLRTFSLYLKVTLIVRYPLLEVQLTFNLKVLANDIANLSYCDSYNVLGFML